MENLKAPETTEDEKPKEGENTKPEEGANKSKEEEGKASDKDEVKDKHGQPGINREKYQRDMQEKDDRIAELEAQIAENTKTEEGRQKLQEQIDEMRKTLEDDRLNFELERAGCLNTKAGRALLEDFDGDIEKLKEGCPYLFSEDKKTGSTGLKPQGGISGIDQKIDKAMGVKE